jgi:hypothetical protein
MKAIGQLIAGFIWVAGWILAQGFWSTFFAVIFPPWGWFLVVEKIMRAQGWL